MHFKLHVRSVWEHVSGSEVFFCLFTRWKPPLSPLTALCTYLIAEKWSQKKSLWHPYLSLLPEIYTCPVYLEQEAVNMLPEPLRRKAHEQKSLVQELYNSSKSFLFSLQPLFPEDVESIFNYSTFQWAWCTINTRTVYMKHSQKECFSREPDNYALAPYLDLLNHSPSVQVVNFKYDQIWMWNWNGYHETGTL